MPKLPSKKVISIFILAAALVAAAIIAFGGDKAGSAISYTNNFVAGDKVSIPENPGWQNELGNLVANSAPSIQDGPADGETVTDIVSRSLVSNYLSLKQSGGLDLESAQKLINQAVEYVEKSGKTEIKTPVLNVIPDNGKQTISDYGEGLGLILKANKPAGSQNELEIFQQLVAGQDPRKAEELQKPIDIYKKAADELTRMPVPKTFVTTHTSIIIGIRSMISGLEDMKKVLDDPFVGLRGVQTYKEGSTLMLQAAQATLNFIKKSGVIYEQGSGGYYFLYGI